MKLLGLDHIGIVVRDIYETIARTGATADSRALGERILAGDINLQFLICGETRLELTEVRAAGFAMPKLKDGETVVGRIGIEVDDLEDAKAELTRRGVVLRARRQDRRGPTDLHGAAGHVRARRAVDGAQRSGAVVPLDARCVTPG